MLSLIIIIIIIIIDNCYQSRMKVTRPWLFKESEEALSIVNLLPEVFFGLRLDFVMKPVR